MALDGFWILTIACVRTARALHPMPGFACCSGKGMPQGTHTVSVGKDQIIESDGYLRWQRILSDTSIRPTANYRSKIQIELLGL